MVCTIADVVPLLHKSSLHFPGKNPAWCLNLEPIEKRKVAFFSTANTLCNQYLFDNGNFEEKSCLFAL